MNRLARPIGFGAGISPRQHRPGRAIGGLGLVLVAVAWLVGCAAPRPVVDVDSMRSRIHTLENRVRELERRNYELTGELQQQARRAEPDDVSAELLANTPRVSEITIGRRSHARDTTGDGRGDELVLYVISRDGRGRFVQMAGELDIRAIAVPADDDAVTIGRRVLSPGEVRDAYHSGVGSIHYTVVLALESDGRPEETIAAVEYRDGWTGLSHRDERSFELIGRRVQPRAR